MSTDQRESDPKPATSRKRVFLSEFFEDWVTRTLGLAHSPLRSLENDDDWTFVIKMHAVVEAAINHLLMVRLNDRALSEIISQLPTNDERKGKMAFIKKYCLLSEKSCLFVRLFSKIRNTAVHDAKSFNLDLTNYVAAIEDNEKPRWKRAFSSWWVPFPDPQHEAAAQHEAAGREHFESALDDPRCSIFQSCMHIVAQAHVQEMNAERSKTI
jgi:hypothetical protein